MDGNSILVSEPRPAQAAAHREIGFTGEVGSFKIGEVFQIVHPAGSRRFAQTEIDKSDAIDAKTVASAFEPESPVAPAHSDTCRDGGRFKRYTCGWDESVSRNRTTHDRCDHKQTAKNSAKMNVHDRCPLTITAAMHRTAAEPQQPEFRLFEHVLRFSYNPKQVSRKHKTRVSQS